MNKTSSQSETTDNSAGKKKSATSFGSAKLIQSDYISGVSFRFPEDHNSDMVVDEPVTFTKAISPGDPFTISLVPEDESYIPPVTIKLNTEGNVTLVELENGWESENNFFRIGGSGDFYVRINLIASDEIEQGIIIVGTVPMPHKEN